MLDGRMDGEGAWMQAVNVAQTYRDGVGGWSETYVLVVELLANTPSERVSLQMADREWRRSVAAMCVMRWVGVALQRM